VITEPEDPRDLRDLQERTVSEVPPVSRDQRVSRESEESVDVESPARRELTVSQQASLPAARYSSLLMRASSAQRTTSSAPSHPLKADDHSRAVLLLLHKQFCSFI